MKRLTIVTLLLLLCLSRASLFAQQSQNPQSDALKIAELEKQLQELKNKHTELENENTKLKTKLADAESKLADAESKFVQVDYGNLLNRLKINLTLWSVGLLGVLGILAGLGGTKLTTNYVREKVAESIAGEREKFDKALQDIEETRQDIESTQNQITGLYENFANFMLADPHIPEGQAKHLRPEIAFDILKNEKPKPSAVEENIITVLGYHEHKEATEYLIEKYLREEYIEYNPPVGLFFPTDALSRMRTQQAYEALIGFLNLIFEKLDSLEVKGDRKLQEHERDQQMIVNALKPTASAIARMQESESNPMLQRAVF